MIDISTINTLCPHRIDNISDPPWWLSDQTIGRIQMQVRFFVGCASIIQLFFRSRRRRYWEDWSGEAEGHWRGGEKGAEWVRLSHWDLWDLEPFPLFISMVVLLSPHPQWNCENFTSPKKSWKGKKKSTQCRFDLMRSTQSCLKLWCRHNPLRPVVSAGPRQNQDKRWFSMLIYENLT